MPWDSDARLTAEVWEHLGYGRLEYNHLTAVGFTQPGWGGEVAHFLDKLAPRRTLSDSQTELRAVQRPQEEIGGWGWG